LFIAFLTLCLKVGVGMRDLLKFASAFICSLALSGCVNDWEAQGPSAAPGGMGILKDGQVADGPKAFSSISQLPVGNHSGPIPPFGTRGHAAAYEYGSGYRVGAGDRLSIRVAGEADLTGEFPVDASGAISLPYVQSVTVSGMTTPQIEQMIVGRLKRGFLRDPQVSVQTIALRPFFILGEVVTAGSYPYQPGMTVQQAIAIAAGFGARADKSVALLTRRDARGTVTTKVPLATQVYPGDILYIRERWF
jgi:polysaccharide biosynthesis/export protein